MRGLRRKAEEGYGLFGSNYLYGQSPAFAAIAGHRGVVSACDRPGALVWGPWRVDRVDLDGLLILRVTNGREFMGDCVTVQEALDLLTRLGVPVDQLVREPSGAVDNHSA